MPSVPGLSDADQAMEQMQADPMAGMGTATPCIGTIVDVEPNKTGAMITLHVSQEHAGNYAVGQQVELGSQQDDQMDNGDQAAEFGQAEA